jgi:outer membrane protein
MSKLRPIFLALMIVAVLAPISAQQITKVAVIDLSKVYMAFFRDSKPVRDLEDKKNKILADMDKMNSDIQALRQQKADADAAGDKSKAQSLDSEIARRTNLSQEYYRTKYAEYEDQKSKLTNSSAFLKDVLKQIESVSESNGYTMVLNIKENEGIVWYSPSVDITDIVISSLVQASGTKQ